MACAHKLRALFALACLVSSSFESYVVTVPKKWIPGGDLQVCVQVKNPEAQQGKVTVRIHHVQQQQNLEVFPPPDGGFSSPIAREITANKLLTEGDIQVPQGDQHLCSNIPLPETEKETPIWWPSRDTISISGVLDGTTVNHTRDIERQVSVNKTIVQTDKYLYKPGQKVRFRVLSHFGPLMKISTEDYREIYVTTPSNNRIAQWLDVDNSKGLVHLEFQLADEPEEGVYNIRLGNVNGVETATTFEVKEYVLPRFEVTVKPPKYVLVTDSSFTFTACAKYTFGEPVKGNISWEINNLQSSGCRSIFTKNDTISGCSEIRVESNDIRVADCNVYNIRAKATVAEEGTGAAEEVTGDVGVERRAVIFETISQDEFLKPNLPFTLKVLAKLPDGTPASGELLEVCHGGSCNNITTPSDGIVKVYLTNPQSRNVVIKRLATRALLFEDSFSHTVRRFYSPSNSSLVIHAADETINCTSGEDTSHTLKVLFASVRQSSALLNVQVMARGKIQYFKSERYELTPSDLPFEEDFFVEHLDPEPEDVVTGVLNIPLALPSTASPKIKVLVWYIRDDGEVVSDVKEMTVEKCLPNKVDFTWSTNRTQPGETASLKLASAPDSICSYGVVDKSVELVSPRQDTVTVDSFFLDDFRYNLQPWTFPQVDDYNYCRRQLQVDIGEEGRYNYYTDYVDTLHIFDQSGLYVFTDLKLETRPCVREEFENRFFGNRIFFGSGGGGASFGGPALEAAPPQSFADTKRAGPPTPPSQPGEEPRTDFPETWLWDLVVVPSNGVLEQNVEVPDTITEWVGKAVCVHPEIGVGVSERASLITYTTFFVDLTLPASIKRGEILPVKISVFNYLQQPLPVRVILESSPEYEFMGEDSYSSMPAGQRLSCIGSQEKAVHTIKIKPTVIGEVNMTVRAFVDTETPLSCGDGSVSVDKRDALIRPITVEAEGFLREETWNKYICANEIAGGEDSIETTQLIVPPGMVEGSERAWVTAVGDLLAISLQNLGSLINMPYGCGEQNMVNFAPNIFILQYLKATDQETPEAKEKLLRYMNTGYQRQLLYMHPDGSYSAFGKADDTGSNWLTAFVLKSFAQAERFIPIDKNTLNVTATWLINSYGEGTCAQSIGKVFHKGLKGGLGTGETSGAPLTAYILISLLESGSSTTDPTVQKALRCLIEDNSGDSYTLALKAYALALSKIPEAPGVLQQLLNQATVTKNSTHWELPKGSGVFPESSSALEVETAGYGILAMMATDPKAYEQQARKVVKWITTQRNGRGGFYSTQDTVVALQALASYESTQFQGDLNVRAMVEANNFQHTFIVTESNKLLYQEASLPVLPTNVTFRMEGQGCALLQTVLRYNDPEPDASDAFSLRVDTRTEQDPFCVTKRISACADYLLPDGASNMAVIEVNLVSGYIPEKEDLKKLVSNNRGIIKRYEVDGNKVSFYIEEITANEVCVNFRVIRQVNVEDAKPGSVVVFDYYQPEFSISKVYQLPDASQCFN
ncbi:alpha-1-inhibitor 3-like [Macrobrachium nipponense]|uniref:alpha-1-inhibitor 3-like n=1 Tax=Macrobrachium nipponense TaxID=159736 RepID=UPI0030C86C44